MLIALFGNLFGEYAYWLDVALNHFELVVMAVTALAFVYISCGVFPRGLSIVFGPCGMSAWVRFRIMLVCKRSRSVQRTMFEFLILKGSGKSLRTKEWLMLIDLFLADKQNHESDGPVFEVGNCLPMTDELFTEVVSRYFSYLNRPHVYAFYSLSSNADFWTSTIRIKDAYVMPAFLLSGLLTRYSQNWEAFLSKYKSISVTSANSGGKVLLDELYNFFAWMIWGPSCEVSWRDDWDGVCQVSYGDESNSLPVFVSVDGDLLSRMREKLQLRLQENCFGALFALDVRIEPKGPFFRKTRGRLLTSNAYFSDRIAENSKFVFATTVVGAQACEDYLSSRYYCTAYLWVLFELDVGPTEGFHPETSVAFFEHANVANSESSVFLCKTLLDKAISHFHRIFADPAARNRQYKFVCAMSKDIEDACRERFARESSGNGEFSEWLSKSVSFDNKYDVNSVFSRIDELFGEQCQNVSYREISPTSRQDLADLSVFYAGVYTDAFPVEGEREELSNIVRYMKKSKTTQRWKFHVLMAMNGREIVGGIIFDYFARTNSVMVEFVVVDHGFRANGLGRGLVKEAIRLADIDSRRAGFHGVARIFCEVESPETCRDSSCGHLKFWRSLWMRRLEFDYVQPSLAKGKLPVRGLWLLSATRGRSDSSVPATVVKDVVRDYAEFSMDIGHSDEDVTVVEMLDSLSGREAVKLLNI